MPTNEATDPQREPMTFPPKIVGKCLAGLGCHWKNIMRDTRKRNRPTISVRAKLGRFGANQAAVVANSSYIGVMENSYLNASAEWKKVGAGGASNV